MQVRGLLIERLATLFFVIMEVEGQHPFGQTLKVSTISIFGVKYTPNVL